MDDREKALEFLRRHASNSPEPPRPKNHEMITAIAAGLGR